MDRVGDLEAAASAPHSGPYNPEQPQDVDGHGDGHRDHQTVASSALRCVGVAAAILDKLINKNQDLPRRRSASCRVCRLSFLAITLFTGSSGL